MNDITNCNFLFFWPANTRTVLFLSIYLLVIASVISLSLYKKSRAVILGWLFVVVGSGVNLYSRSITGCVTDNINFFGLVSFNIYDVLIVIGTAVLLWVLFKSGEK